jgi:hypothetical protein
MNKSIIIIALLLSACVNLQFDSLEYDRYISIKQLSDQGGLLCGDPAVLGIIPQLSQEVNHQYIYAANREARPQVNEAVTNLKLIVDKLYDRYKKETPSKTYCREKFKNISLGVDTIIRQLGRL